MGSWLLERRLTQTASRLKELRSELVQIDEQLAVVGDEASDHELRALMSETPSAAFEANDSRRHANALSKHRAHVCGLIGDLETRQDELLDRMTSGR